MQVRAIAIFPNVDFGEKIVASCRRGNEVNEAEFEARREEKLTSKKIAVPVPLCRHGRRERSFPDGDFGGNAPANRTAFRRFPPAPCDVHLRNRARSRRSTRRRRFLSRYSWPVQRTAAADNRG